MSELQKWSWGGETQEASYDEIRREGGALHFLYHPADERGYGVIDDQADLTDAELLAHGPPWPIPLDVSRALVAALGAPPPAWLLVLELCEACRGGRLERARELVAQGADVNGCLWQSWYRSGDRNRTRQLPLDAALFGGQPAVVRWLLEQGARPRELNAKTGGIDESVLSALGQMPSAEALLEALLACGATWSTTEIDSPLIGIRHAGLARVLLAHGAPLELQTSRQGWTPLFWAVSSGQLEVVKVFIAAGANLRHRDHEGRSILRIAVDYGKLEVARCLIGAGAELEPERAADGRTPLEEARRLASAQPTWPGGAKPHPWAAEMVQLIEAAIARPC